jgi:hypothetical protein
MLMARCIAILVGGLASLSAVSLSAQEAVLEQQYGLGVHAYFSGDYPKAFEQLAVAIQGGLKDPRAFYFRGLSYRQLGRGPEAIADFKKGAELESTDINKFYNVSKSLERVQGAGRAQLESYRMQARMTAIEQAERFRKARYEMIQREESRVVREMTIASEPIETPAPAAEPAAEEDPFTAPLEKSAPKAAKKSAKASKKAADEPANDEAGAKPAEAAAEDKKPAEEAKEPAAEGEKTPAAEKKPDTKKDADDPFAS